MAWIYMPNIPQIGWPCPEHWIIAGKAGYLVGWHPGNNLGLKVLLYSIPGGWYYIFRVSLVKEIILDSNQEHAS